MTAPTELFPWFYSNPAVRDVLAPQRLWTVSDRDKRPVDIVSTLDPSPICPRCGRPGCSDVHGAQLSEASSQLLTLPELTTALPSAANVAVHLDSRTTGLMVLDIEPACPPEVVDQLLRLVTGNAAQTPTALYSELSGSGRGYHLIMPTPTVLGSFPKASGRLKLQHPQRWYEILLYHWITFSRRPIPDDRLRAAAASGRGEELTWDGVFAQLAQIAPGVNGDSSREDFDASLGQSEAQFELTGLEAEIADDVVARLAEEGAKDLDADFAGDTSRWENSRLIRIANVATDRVRTRLAIAAALGQSVDDEQRKQMILRICYAVAREVLPYREKHDQRRGSVSYLLKRVTEALGYVEP